MGISLNLVGLIEPLVIDSVVGRNKLRLFLLRQTAGIIKRVVQCSVFRTDPSFVTTITDRANPDTLKNCEDTFFNRVISCIFADNAAYKG